MSEPTQLESASNSSKPQTPNKSGKETLNAEAQLSSGKDTKYSGNNQINKEENAENQSKAGEKSVQNGCNAGRASMQHMKHGRQ